VAFRARTLPVGHRLKEGQAMGCNIADDDTGNHRIPTITRHRELEIHSLDQWPASPTTDWLIAQAVLYANATDQTGARIIELLRERDDAVDALTSLVRATPPDRTPLRMNLLRLLGDLEDPSAAEFLSRLASEPLPGNGIRTMRGGSSSEVGVRRMAVEALRRIAERHSSASEALLRVVAARPLRPILVDALKAASELHLNARVRQLLPTDHDAADLHYAASGVM
jgi:hypothetical protein